MNALIQFYKNIPIVKLMITIFQQFSADSFNAVHLPALKSST